MRHKGVERKMERQVCDFIKDPLYDNETFFLILVVYKNIFQLYFHDNFAGIKGQLRQFNKKSL